MIFFLVNTIIKCIASAQNNGKICCHMCCEMPLRMDQNEKYSNKDIIYNLIINRLLVLLGCEWEIEKKQSPVADAVNSTEDCSETDYVP